MNSLFSHFLAKGGPLFGCYAHRKLPGDVASGHVLFFKLNEEKLAQLRYPQHEEHVNTRERRKIEDQLSGWNEKLEWQTFTRLMPNESL